MKNPLFPTTPDPGATPQPHPAADTPQPVVGSHALAEKTTGRNAAANVIRRKLEKIYAKEPNVKQELAELPHADRPLSKHQQFLQNLQNAGLSVAEVQTKWHEYYVNLPEPEKHEVWREFYAEQAQHTRYAKFMAAQSSQAADQKQDTADQKPAAVVSSHRAEPPPKRRVRDARSTREIKQSLSHTLNANGKLKPKHHLQSLAFGLASGGAVLIIMLFGLFNETIIAPFIQPSRNVSATPIIMDGASLAADGKAKIIIPKINVEIPVDYSLTSMQEDVIQNGLENGVVHYPSTVRPGQQGNVALFGHSSNNLFNPGKYKFAFVLLSKLEPGDMFYLTYDKKVYAYRMYEKKIVNPEDTWVLNPVEGKAATAALITCDPPGTTRYRLVVWGEQVSPDPATATPAGQNTTNAEAAETQPLPGPPRSLLNRLTGGLL